MWDEEDGFYYDVLQLPDAMPRGSRSLHGGPAALWRDDGHRTVAAGSHTAGDGSHRATPAPDTELRETIHPRPGPLGRGGPGNPGHGQTERLRRILAKMLDENESWALGIARSRSSTSSTRLSST